ncbi:transcriptional regulator [Brevibacillus sp. HD3.3A]|uniref:transcriptional regulator n=1 Tax=Brevibacillus sp. HD3.3A TaxID=2738979 RepID=UPI001C2CB549|nr:transcriptional regulator [Brevibacillus sp. HD3.3A]UED70721.1 transcriptional regulator [Brevibacillus sp. HD3.3A]
MFGLGKSRTPLGKFLDQNRIMQKEVEQETKISNPIVTKACNDPNYIPSPSIQKKFLDFVRKKGWKQAKAHDLWPM